MKNLKIAGVTFGFETEHECQCVDNLEFFEECPPVSVPDYSFRSVVAELPPFPAEKPEYEDMKTAVYPDRIYYRIPNNPWNACLDCQTHTIYTSPRVRDYAKNMWNLLDKIQLPTLMLEHDTVLLHSSYILYEGQAILFTAPSGVGKSTQARLWEETLGATVVNGDRSYVRLEKHGASAHGTPFSGTSGICRNLSAPIRAIVILSQAPENSVRFASVKECIHFFYTQTTICRQDPEQIVSALELWEKIYQQVPILCHPCTPDPEAVYSLKDFLDRKEYAR